jgi:DNA-binding transcriptional ArsR family regulator
VSRPESIEGTFLANRGDYEVDIGQRLLRLTTEPIGFRVLVLLNDRSATVGEVAEALELSTDAIAWHLDKLRDEGLIELVGEVLRSGAVEPRYRASVRTLWSDEEWATLSMDERQRLTAWTVEWIHGEIREAVDAGTFSARPDSHISRNVSFVDEQGWRELTRIQEEALEASFVVHAASTERLAEKGEPGIPVLSAMLCCELPPRRGRQGG